MKTNKFNSIKKACKINDIIFKEIVNNFSFKTEKGIEKYIRKRFKEFRVGSAFIPIVANNNSVIHAEPRKQKLRRGFLILDFAARVNGFSSDMTRTIFLGKANKKEKKLYNLILNCQKKCIQKAKIGTDCKKLDEYARKILGNQKKNFKHSLGHGVGSRIHMKPRISRKSTDVLKKGDFITIEPGIYVKNKDEEFGIRIEDTLYIGTRTESLTKSSKKFIEI